MSNKSIRYLSYFVKAGILILPVLSLIISESLFFPFITLKNIFFRVVVEILLAIWIIMAVFDKKYRPKATPLVAALGFLVFFMMLSTVFGENPYKSFWSNFERMEGLIGHLHLFAYFLILASVFQKKRDWKWLFGSMLVVSLIASIYGFLQWTGKVAIHQSHIRLDATFGNATYLAIYIVFHLFLISLFIFWFRNLWFRIFLGVLFLAEFFIMFLTATRGAILGFFGGLFLFGLLMAVFSKGKKLRIIFASCCLLVVVLFSLFLALKNTSFVKSNYVLSRFSSISFSERTTESRLTIWGMSLKGFQEHPILGWGPENYNLVFNKYYEPKLYKQEPWFDRSHNVIFDWLTMTGVLGFLAYLGIFGSALYLLWKGYKKKYFGVFEVSLITSLFAAYLFHNLFVFDNLTSYFMFFSVLAYINSAWVFTAEEKISVNNKDKKDKQHNNNNKKQKEVGWGGYFLITGSVLLVIFSLYYVNLIPFRACKALLVALQSAGSLPPSEILKSFEKVLAFNSLATGEAREQLAGYANNVVGSPSISNKDKKEVLAFAQAEMEKQVEQSPNDIRYLIMLTALYKSDQKYDKALATVQRAVVLSPKKQQLYFLEADIYFNLGRAQEAVDAARIAYELDHSYWDAVVNLAVLNVLTNKLDEAESVLIENLGTSIVPEKQLLNAYAHVGNYIKVRDIWLVIIEGEPENAQYYVNLAATHMQLNERDEAVVALQKAMELNPEFVEQAQFYINEINAGRNP